MCLRVDLIWGVDDVGCMVEGGCSLVPPSFTSSSSSSSPFPDASCLSRGVLVVPIVRGVFGLGGGAFGGVRGWGSLRGKVFEDSVAVCVECVAVDSADLVPSV